MKKVLIVVDAGGTKTKVAIIDKNRSILKEAIVGSGSPAAMKDEAFKNIKQGINIVLEEIKKEQYQLMGISMGISGLGVVKNKQEIEQEFKDIYQVPIIMENDAVIALYSIVQDKYQEGVMVLAGTGSSILGIKNETTSLIGGWGHLLNEKGSAYSCVKDYIIKIIDKYEQTKEITPLGKKFMQELNYKDIQEFKVLMYQNTKKDVASYASFFSKEAVNDLEAKEWLKQNGIFLGNDVLNCIRMLNLSSFVIGFRGGFISHVQEVQDSLLEHLKQNGFNPLVVQGDEDPIYGAYYMGLRRGLLC